MDFGSSEVSCRSHSLQSLGQLWKSRPENETSSGLVVKILMPCDLASFICDSFERSVANTENRSHNLCIIFVASTEFLAKGG